MLSHLISPSRLGKTSLSLRFECRGEIGIHPHCETGVSFSIYRGHPGQCFEWRGSPEGPGNNTISRGRERDGVCVDAGRRTRGSTVGRQRVRCALRSRVLKDKTDGAFRPFGLDVFDKLSRICGGVRSRLKTESAKLSGVTPGLPSLVEGTRARALVDSLTPLTKVDDVRALATLSKEEERRRQPRGGLAPEPPRRTVCRRTAAAPYVTAVAQSVPGPLGRRDSRGGGS
jgi:hypothetical protein